MKPEEIARLKEEHREQKDPCGSFCYVCFRESGPNTWPCIVYVLLTELEALQPFNG